MQDPTRTQPYDQALRELQPSGDGQGDCQEGPRDFKKLVVWMIGELGELMDTMVADVRALKREAEDTHARLERLEAATRAAPQPPSRPSPQHWPPWG
jgi:hypothetical protein